MIKTPAHWSTADIKDIERELVGLIDERPEAVIDVKGIRLPGMYRQVWASPKHSKNIRNGKGFVMEVKYETLR